MALLPLETSEAVPGLGLVARLTPERCRALLAKEGFGHLALSQNALPLVVPATYIVDGDHLVARVGPGVLLRPGPSGGVVAFQTASAHLEEAWRWDVVVQGRAEVLASTPARATPPPLPLVDNDLTTIVRIGMELMTGWQYGEPPRVP